MIEATTRNRRSALALLLTPALLTLTRPAWSAAQNRAVALTESDIVAAQREWEAGLLEIARTYANLGADAARARAARMIDRLYGYAWGPVLFKPTLAGGSQTFRTTRAGALAYFAGGDSDFPDDTGFALKPWREVRIRNIGMQIRHDTAMVMSRAVLTDAQGKVTEVDKTWGYRRGPEGVRIVLHHSSLARVE